jgi:hypothetical protein
MFSTAGRETKPLLHVWAPQLVGVVVGQGVVVGTAVTTTKQHCLSLQPAGPHKMFSQLGRAVKPSLQVWAALQLVGVVVGQGVVVGTGVVTTKQHCLSLQPAGPHKMLLADGRAAKPVPQTCAPQFVGVVVGHGVVVSITIAKQHCVSVQPAGPHKMLAPDGRALEPAAQVCDAQLITGLTVVHGLSAAKQHCL